MRGPEPDWRTANEKLAGQLARHLSAARYGQAAELLDQLQRASKQQGAQLTAQMLEAARALCLDCSQHRATAQWHQEASAQAGERERELRQQLQKILDLVYGGPPVSQWKMPTVPTAQSLPSIEAEGAEAPSPLRLWARAQSMLGRWRIARPPESGLAVMPGGEPSPDELDGIAKAEGADRTADSEIATPDFIAERQTDAPAPPCLVVYSLGPFWVYQDERPVSEWQSSRGKAIFKYLLAHRDRPMAKEVLMELFWPGADPDAARNNLNVAIYGLRQTLRETRPSYSHILFRDDCYLLNPNLEIWMDADEFDTRLHSALDLEQRGDLDSAVSEYHAAEALYQGEFMEEDRYEDWLLPQRQRFQEEYLRLLDRLSRWYYDQGDYAACGIQCRKMLAVESCCEEAHRRLMECYHKQGQPYLALRQYHLCVEALREELEIDPTPATTDVYDCIRHHRQI